MGYLDELKSASLTIEGKLNDVYTRIGKSWFELHKDDSEPAELAEEFFEAKELCGKMDSVNEKIEKIKNCEMCHACGAAVPEGFSFCGNCGVRLNKPQPKVEEKPAEPEQEKQEGVCPKCGNINGAGAVFCEECGTKLTSEPKQDVCPACGAPVAEDSVFCTECGKKLK